MIISEKEAIYRLKNGEVVALPTETVYGLAACYRDVNAIDKIFKIKGRPRENPLILHIFSLNDAADFLETFPNAFFRLAEAFSPGPLTLVLPIKKGSLHHEITAGLPTAAFRSPNCPVTRRIIKETGPLVMPSANLSGKPSATIPEHIEEDFGSCFPVVKGNGHGGLESTILGFFDGRWKILRQGALSQEIFFPVLGYAPDILYPAKGEKPLSPGQLFRHYAPKAKLILSKEFSPSDTIVGFTDLEYPEGAKVFFLGNSNDPEEVAKHLYITLRLLDQEGVKNAVIDIRFPKIGLFRTIFERLEKAAKSKP